MEKLLRQVVASGWRSRGSTRWQLVSPAPKARWTNCHNGRVSTRTAERKKSNPQF